MAVKLVPGGHPYHALAEAAANAAREAQTAAEAIESITVSRPGMTALTGPLHPSDLIDMAHSPAYFTAAGVADRDFSWEHASPAKIADPVIHPLIDKVRVGAAADRECRALPPGRHGDDPHARRAQLHEHGLCAEGLRALGIAWSDIDAKFRRADADERPRRSQVEASLRLIHDFRSAASVVPLLRSLEVVRHD